nr:carbohydrate kinase [Labedaea rhizosphaerae]
MIVVGGEALIDMVPVGTDNGDPAFAARPGGGPFNVAVGAARLGCPVSMLTRLSTDAFGEKLLAGLRSAGVHTDLVQRGPEATSLAVTGIGDDGSAEYRFYVDGTADRLVRAPALPPGTSAFVAGTLGMVLEPGASAYEALLRRAHTDRALTVLDPNIRPDLIADPDAYRARFWSWLSTVDILKLSAEDAEWLGGDVRGWLAAGPSAVVLTLGGQGLEAVTAAATIKAPPVPVTVADTVGAGDTVLATLLYGLHERDALRRDAVRALDEQTWRAVLDDCAAAAAWTCARTGAQSPTVAQLRGSA